MTTDAEVRVCYLGFYELLKFTMKEFDKFAIDATITVVAQDSSSHQDSPGN
jgi:hypothetical protein